MSSEAGSRRRILDATLACARARPDFSMAEVAAGARVSRQGVYLHFPDRAALLATLRADLDLADGPEIVERAPSARAALTSVLTHLAERYAQVWPALRATGNTETPGRLPLCQALVARFRAEGALAPHLSPATAADILFSLTSPALWHELVEGRGWDATRYRTHLAFLAVSALTK
jgi:AcrR family transcriptional regulator